MDSLTNLESAVLSEVASQLCITDRTALQSQIVHLIVRKRENTGAGFFTDFDIATDAIEPIQVDTRDCYVEAEVHGLEFGLGFVLWLKDGRLDFLEGYSYGEDTDFLDLTNLTFAIHHGAKLHRIH